MRQKQSHALWETNSAILQHSIHETPEVLNVDLSITIRAAATFSSNVWNVGSQEVRVGYEYILKTSEFELTGIISGMEADNG